MNTYATAAGRNVEYRWLTPSQKLARWEATVPSTAAQRHQRAVAVRTLRAEIARLATLCD